MNEREILKYKLMMYGYEYGIEPIQINDKLLEIAKFFAKNQQIVNSKTTDCLYKANQTEISDSTRKFFDKRFKLHKVPFITEEEAKLIEKEYMESNHGYNYLLRETKEKSVLIEKIGWVKTKEQVPMDVKYTNPRISYDNKYWYLSVGIEVEMPIV